MVTRGKGDGRTGLPELPDGYVWRVREGSFGGNGGNLCQTLVVEVCQKNWRGLKVVVSDNLIDRNLDRYFLISKDPTPANVQHCANEVYSKFVRKMDEQAEHTAEVEARRKLVGTYPPKKLNN